VGPTLVAYPGNVTLLVEAYTDGLNGVSPPANLVPVCYAIATVNSVGEGPKSADVCTTPFKALDPSQFPGGNALTLAISGTTSVSLNWADIPVAGNSGNGGYAVEGYEILRSQDGGATYTQVGTVPEPASATAATMGQFVDSNKATGASYYYRVAPVDAGGNLGLSYAIKFVDIPSGQNALYVFKNSFNPARGETVAVQCGLQESGNFWIKVYTLNGEYVNTLMPATRSQGSPSVPWLSAQVLWDGRNASGQTVASGVYLIHLEASGYRADARVAVIK
jgi:hypothetical protein